MIAVNGPEVVHSESVVRESLSQWLNEEDVHFIRKSKNVKSWLVSKSIDNLRNSIPKNKLIFRVYV